MSVEKEVIDIDLLEEEKSRIIFESLCSIFPDACPLYLQGISDKHMSDRNLEALINRLLKTKNYPRRSEEVQSPLPVNAHLASVEAFVTHFNDPQKYFSERNVGIDFYKFSKLYLMSRFNHLKVKTINDVLMEKQNNLTLAFHSLENMAPDLISKRSKHQIISYKDCPNQEFHDEIFYIEHESEINNLKTMQEFELIEAKANNELFVCLCCFSDEVLGREIITCTEGHIFCESCVKKSVEIGFGEGKTEFKCLTDCDSHFLIESFRGFLSKNLVNKIELKIQESEIKSADISGICFCPFCEYAVILPEDEKVFKCAICNKESCRYCQKSNHIPMSCEEYEQDVLKTNARSKIEDKMTEALLRECYNCKKKFIKEDGCNKMVCTCGAIMCYICREPVKDYSHFIKNRIENQNQPSTSSQQDKPKCPLWTNNDKLHVDAVVQAAKAASAEIEKEHPEFHFETSPLLKGLKRKYKS